MDNKFFVSCFFIIFTLVTISVYSVYADKEAYEIPAGADAYADVHGNVEDMVFFDKVAVHVHGIVYAEDDPNNNSDAAGNYTLILTVSEPEGNERQLKERRLKKWGRENFQSNVYLQGSFQGELREEEHITFEIEPRMKIGNSLRNIGWTASATVQLVNSLGEPDDPIRDYDEKKIDEREESEVWEDAQGDAGSTRDLGISVADSEQTPQPGDSVTLNLVTPEPYYDITLYVKRPWDTSERGTYQDYTYGDGTSTQTSFSYTFPTSGSTDATGDFLFTAVIYRWSDMSSYEETYTLSVSDSSSSAASDPPPYNADCTLCTLYSTQGCSQCQ